MQQMPWWPDEALDSQPGEEGTHTGGRLVGHRGCEEGREESSRGVTGPEEGHVGLRAAAAEVGGGA